MIGSSVAILAVGTVTAILALGKVDGGIAILAVLRTVEGGDWVDGKAAGAGVVIILHAHSSLAGHAAALQTGNILNEHFFVHPKLFLEFYLEI